MGSLRKSPNATAVYQNDGLNSVKYTVTNIAAKALHMHILVEPSKLYPC